MGSSRREMDRNNGQTATWLEQKNHQDDSHITTTSSSSGTQINEPPKTLEQLHALLDKREREIARLHQELEKVRKESQAYEETIDKIFSSRSWRLTSYLRKIGKLVRGIFPLLRFRKHNFKLLPQRNTTFNGTQLVVSGPSATILLEPFNGVIPKGWVTLKTVLKSEKRPLFFLLYFGRSGDFNPQNRVWITIDNVVMDETTFRIPEWCSELRLDPFDQELSFTPEKFEIREIGKAQVLYSLLKRQLKPVVRHPQLLIKKTKKFFAILRESGLYGIRLRLFANDLTSNYQEWVQKYDTLTSEDLSQIKKAQEKLTYLPLISIVMPVYNVAERWLRAALDSVLAQTYQNWELCIADDASSEPYIEPLLQEYSQRDARIKYIIRKENGHISEASNSALNLANGEFIALLDHDDEIRPHALYCVVESLNSNKEANLIYSDEDKITSFGMRFNPYFKGDWNPELFLQQNFICHLGVYRTELVKSLGGFRKGFEGAQDWDLALRVIDASDEKQIIHIPQVLYHWRVIEGSTAQSTGYKPYVMEAQARAVREHLARSFEHEAKVEILDTISQLRVRFPLPQNPPLISIIIPTKDQVHYLRKCIDSIVDRTTYKNYEILVVDNGSVEPSTKEYLERLSDRKIAKVLLDKRPFNFSQLNNTAVKEASGEILAFLNNDLEVLEPDWLSEMVSHILRKGVGSVGARLLFPNDLLQHGGVVIGIGGVAGHSHKGRPRQDPGYFNRAILTQAVSGVTAACMLVRKEVFEQVGGFDEQNLAVAFNDVDLSLKIREAGYRIVYCPYAELYHYESVSRGFENTPKKFVRFEREIEVMKERWGKKLENDPYYNPNLTLILEDFSFAFPPRVKKPWRN